MQKCMCLQVSFYYNCFSISVLSDHFEKLNMGVILGDCVIFGIKTDLDVHTRSTMYTGVLQ